MFTDLKEHDFQFLFALLINDIAIFKQCNLHEQLERCYSALEALYNDFSNIYGDDHDLLIEVRNCLLKIEN